MNQALHESVMLPEVLHYLAPRDGEIYIDGTVGRAGHSKAILKAANCEIIAIDRDPEAIAEISAENIDGIKLYQAPFSALEQAAAHYLLSPPFTTT